MCDGCEKVLELEQSKNHWLESYKELVAEFQFYKAQNNKTIKELEAEIDKLNEQINSV